MLTDKFHPVAIDLSVMLGSLRAASQWWIFPVLLLVVSGCQDGSRVKDELTTLEQQLAALENEHTRLDVRIDSLWDETAQHLEAAIPPGFPPLDRELFIRARNADHIRMFMSFDQLDSTTRELVHSAGYADQMLAAHMRQLIEKKGVLSARRHALLIRLSDQGDLADPATPTDHPQNFEHKEIPE